MRTKILIYLLPRHSLQALWRTNIAGMEAKLSHLISLPSKDQANGYLSLLSDVLIKTDQSGVASDIRHLVDFVTQDHVNIVVGRPVIAELVRALDEKRVRDRETRKAILEDCLRIIQPRITRFEEQVRNTWVSLQIGPSI